MRPARPAAATVALFAATLAVCAVAGASYRDDPFATTYVADALSYHEWAERLATNGLAAEPPFHQAPLFPLLLAAIYSVTDPAARAAAALALQALLTATAVALLVPVGRRFLGSTPAGVAAALLALGHAPLVFHALKLLPVPLAIATQLAALAALGVARDGRRPAAAAVAGALAGLAVAARSEMLLFVPVGIAALVLGATSESDRGAAPPARRARLAGAFVLGLVAATAPFTLHNLRRGDFSPIASSAGENLYAGNRRGADGGHAAIDPRAGDLFSQRALAARLAEEAAGRALRPAEVSAWWRARALAEVRADPGAWLRLEGRKLARILDPGDPADMYSLALERARYLPELYALPVAPWGLWLLGVPGVVLALRRHPGLAWPAVALVAIHVAVLLAFFVSTRLRLPLLVALTPFAGLGALETARAVRRGGRRRLAAGALALAVVATSAGWIVTLRPSFRETLRLASVLSTRGRLDESLAVLAPWTRRPDPEPIALDQTGWVLSKRGDLAAAADAYRRALAEGLPPEREGPLRSRLAEVLERRHDLAAAAAEHEAAVRAARPWPWQAAGALVERAGFRLRRGDRAGALADLDEAARLAPDWPEPARLRAALSGPAG